MLIFYNSGVTRDIFSLHIITIKMIVIVVNQTRPVIKGVRAVKGESPLQIKNNRPLKGYYLYEQ